MSSIANQKANSIASLSRYNKAKAARVNAAIQTIRQGKITNVDAFVEKFYLLEEKNDASERHDAFEAQLHKDEETETHESETEVSSE
jgi:hypothetical protein